MIEINHTLLSTDALDNLVLDVITRQSTDYSEYEIDISQRKSQLIRKLVTGEAAVVYCSKDGFCYIVNLERLKIIQNKIITEENVHD